ncbi:MAG: type II secretion system protein [Oscillospiraceae bacterium]|nr:type II secretion system protein [Oscillospiraceae bacterium]
MRLTKRKKHLPGMTLIEVTVGMVIIIIVTLIAYMGVSASANFTARGTDLRNADGPAVSMVEAQREAALNAVKNNETPAVTEVVINYKVYQIVQSASEDGSGDTAAVTSVVVPNVGNDFAQINAGLIEAEVTDNGVDVRYDMYLPKKETP